MVEDAANELAIADPFEGLRQELERWRGSHPPRSRLPDEIWSAAAGLARQHGLYRTSRSLQLDYGCPSSGAALNTGQALEGCVQICLPTR